MVQEESRDYLGLIYRRVFQQQDPALVQVSFAARVVDKYRCAPGYRLVRTDTVGRITREGAWSLDVGIVEEAGVVHARLSDLMYTLPEAEREHWAQHVVAPPMSRAFLQMSLAPSSCIDDGDVRSWE